MASFAYKGQLNGAENPVIVNVKIGNSNTLVVGEAARLQTFSSGGGAIRATAGTKVLGIVVGIVDANGIDLDNANSSNFDGTWTSSSKTYVASASNMTGKQVSALVVVDPEAIWENVTAGTLAVADELKFFDLTDQTQIADQNGHDSAGSFVLLKRDADDSTKGTFKIAESMINPYAQQ